MTPFPVIPRRLAARRVVEGVAFLLGLCAPAGGTVHHAGRAADRARRLPRGGVR